MYTVADPKTIIDPLLKRVINIKKYILLLHNRGYVQYILYTTLYCTMQKNIFLNVYNFYRNTINHFLESFKYFLKTVFAL